MTISASRLALAALLFLFAGCMAEPQGYTQQDLEARCLMLVKGAGAQGVQNGSISCIALPSALPGGVRAVLAENLIAATLGL